MIKIVTILSEGWDVSFKKRQTPCLAWALIPNHFHLLLSAARNGYRQFVADGIAMGRRPDLTGGGLIRSAGGLMTLKSAQEGRGRTKSDERILGDGEFVESVLKEADEKIERRQCKPRIWSFRSRLTLGRK